MKNKHTIDTDKSPYIPYDGWTVESHQKSGTLVWDPKKAFLHIEEGQKEGYIEGTKLQALLKGQPVMNANVLDYLYEHQELIPEDWKKNKEGQTQNIFFWGTVYRGSDGGLRVRCLCWDDGSWDRSYYWLGGVFGVQNPAAVSASALETQPLRSEPLPLELAIKMVKKEGYKIYKEI